ncbi:LysR substrate-binding domain-containing protein [Mesorhizobium amorphae]|uniref:LysR family transcriptional regulator n=1 Tax=Mesorhizobium amorphae CCNWGS0123 TaxID=1082933 RepID=G6YGB1_9HYPH|nr:LysR substrate-binding domain-containing protein [Mesorhizobium amorphae]ANT50662.1 LysR family transcriptional regulator [Mesorhizobium amorphae CCNWGS0123]EHH09201.1 LysR family transcriptional regulator [Mesorhizobium amorphae CCNWGS0123]GLR42422.1 LysR family transcriptional regulator [Mesorhizobium amorphae]
MHKPELRELIAFAEAARQLNFTRAAAALGVSLPSFSQTLRGLEEKLGVRLLTRTTRSVSLTAAGEELLTNIVPILSGLDSVLDGLNKFRSATGGKLRILGSRTATTVLIAPLIGRFLARHPEIEFEILVEDLHLDLVEHRIDAGIQVGERIEKDMIAVRIAEPFNELLFAAKDYLMAHGEPSAPGALVDHRCVRLRSPWDGTIQPWTLHKGDEKAEPVTGTHVVANDLRAVASAIAGGAGIGLVPAVLLQEELRSGRVVTVLEGWGSPISGIYLYYPSRRQIPAALAAFIAFMKQNRPALHVPAKRKPQAQ